MTDQEIVVVVEPVADEPETTQQQHAASLPDNPPFPDVSFKLNEAGAPDVRPPVWPNSSS